MLRDLASFAVLGLGPGAVYATLALGIVLVYRVTGVVNFAHGAMAMLAVYVFVAALPVTGSLGAVAVAVLVSATVGAAAHFLVFRHLADRPPLAGVVASVGILTALQGLVTLVFGTDSRGVPSLLPSGPVAFAGTVIPVDRLLLGAFVAAVAAGLWAVFRFTGFGLASRAAATDATSLSLLGWSPAVLAGMTWILASVLGGVGAVLAGPITALDPVSSTLLVVPALGAAVVGRMSSFGFTALAAVGLGAAQSMVLVAQDRIDWLPRTGVREGLPLAVIVVALALGGARQLSRGQSLGRAPRLPLAPRSGRPGFGSVLAVAMATVALLIAGPQLRLAAVTSLIGAVLCLSLVILTGYAGQISLAQMAFAGVAGFALTALGDGLGVPFPLAPLLAAALAALCGVVVGYPALRVRGASLAVATLASAVVLEDLVFKNPALTGGFAGVEVPDLGLGPPSSVPFAIFTLVVLASLAVGVGGLRRSGFGQRCLAVRADEVAAQSVGVDTAATRLVAFALSAFVAGLGGSLLAYSQAQLSFGSFGVFVSLSLLAVAYLGGIARVSGALVGGLLVSGGLVFGTLDRVAGLGRYQLLVTGLALVAVVILRPEGIVTKRANR